MHTDCFNIAEDGAMPTTGNTLTGTNLTGGGWHG